MEMDVLFAITSTTTDKLHLYFFLRAVLFTSTILSWGSFQLENLSTRI